MRKFFGAFKNRILFAALMIFAALVSLLGFNAAKESTVALEQLPRCGMEEHIHSEECYTGDFLVCGQKTHIHGENCYILRLADNDINGLLSQVDAKEDKNLENLLSEVLVEAMTVGRSLSGGVWTPVDDGNPMTNDSVAMLNRAISDGVISSDIVLNEALSSNLTVTDGEGETFVLLAAAGDNARAVGGTASTSYRAINFYIVLDGKITFVNSGSLTYNNRNSNQDKREYCSYSVAANAYSSALVTNVSTSTLGRNYYFRYNTNGNVNNAASFNGAAIFSNSNVYFEDSIWAQYAILSSSSGSTSPVNFYTVTLDMSEVGGGVQKQYVESGLNSTLNLSSSYRWYDANGKEVSQTALNNIRATTTLYAGPKGGTVNFDTNGGSAIPTVNLDEGEKLTRPEDPTRSGYVFAGWYSDEALTREYSFGNSVEGSITLYAKWTPRSDYVFTFNYTDAGGTVIKTEYARNLVYDSDYTLPDPGSGFVWISEGESYSGGSTVTVSGNRSFTAATKTLRLSYNLNFPTSSTITVTTKPSIVGYSGTIVVGSGGSTVLSPSSTMVVGTRTIQGARRNCVAYFAGWTVDSPDGPKLIRPGINLTWRELSSYADEDGNINLVGTWNTQTNEIARFFMRLDSTAADFSGSNIDTSSSKYTGEIFTTYVGGEPNTGFKIEDDTPDNSYTADREIRSLLGERSDGVWIYSVPSDEYMFEQLRQYTSTSLSDANRLRFVDTNGRTVEYVKADELDSDHYAIRWYVFKHESDGWHVDGRLVKKEGIIHVEKTFAGEEDIIAAAKKGFCIVAENPGAESKRKVLLKLAANDSSVQTPAGTTETIVPYSVSDDKLTYVWHISDVEYGEQWSITEKRTVPENASVYTEYSIYDSKGTQSAISRYGTSVSVSGVTYAPDEGNDHILRAEFRNFYHRSDSIAIKKEDGKSGKPIGGASFELWQQMTDANGNKNWIQLMFSYDENGNLEFDQENGTVSRVSTDNTGYSEIIIKDFSYDAGPVLVREVEAPNGYVPAPEIMLQNVSGGSDNEAEIVSVGGDPYDPNNSDDHMYAEYHTDEKVLVVKNYSQATTTISAKKGWAVPEELRADSVTVELYANGVLASSLVPSIEPIVQLKKENAYTYVWDDMPTVINGEGVVWTIKETKVGDETLTVNGSFVNWIDTYNRYETRDSDGALTALTLEVTNDLRRTLLYVEKTDVSGLTPLYGASFNLRKVEREGDEFVPVSGGYNTDSQSNENGWILFDNLTAGYYLLTEVTPPAGYRSLETSVYLYVDASGKIKQAYIQDGAIVTLPDGQFEGGLSRPNDFVIRVPNHKLEPLPETGGVGTAAFSYGGATLMAAAMLGLYLKLRRKEDADA